MSNEKKIARREPGEEGINTMDTAASSLRGADPVRKHYEVHCQKFTKTWTMFQRYDHKDEADKVAARLMELGCVARVQVAKVTR